MSDNFTQGKDKLWSRRQLLKLGITGAGATGAAALWQMLNVKNYSQVRLPPMEIEPSNGVTSPMQILRNFDYGTVKQENGRTIREFQLTAGTSTIQNQPKRAEPHIGHPVEEIYVDVEEQLNERKVKEFKTSLENLTALVKSNPKDAKIKTNFTSSMAAVDGAIAALSAEQLSKPAFIVQIINGLLDSANSEYSAAITNGKISAPIEYQDSRGFVAYSNQLYKGISSQMAQENPEAHKAIDTTLAELVKVWPAAIPPAQAVKTPEDVTKLVKTIEENTRKVLLKVST